MRPHRGKLSLGKSRKSLLAFWIVANLLAIGVCAAYYFREANQIEQTLKERESIRVAILSRVFGSDFSHVVANLRILADDDNLQDFLISKRPEERRGFIRAISRFARQSKGYDQVRLLDNQGKDMSRVNGDGVAVEEESLQDKSNRPYFYETHVLSAGDIFLSSFNLNVEHGVTQIPIKPILRFATPVVDRTGTKQGVLVINMLGAPILASFERNTPTYQHRLRMLNDEGYWLRAAKPEMEWGFQLPESSAFNLARNSPELWHLVSKEPQGQASYEGGFFTWQRLSPSALVTDTPTSKIVAGDRYLIIASHVTAKERIDLLVVLRESIILLGLLLVATTSLFTGILHSRRKTATELHAADTLRTAILHSAGVAIIATDPQGTIVTFNDTASRWLGWQPDEVIDLQTPAIFHDAEEVATKAKALSEELGTVVKPGFEVFVAKARQGDDTESEWTYIRRDGSKFPVSLVISVLYDEAQRVAGFLGIATDITERKKAEQLLLTSRDAAEASVRLKSQFLANMSHEIRTPMNGVVGMAGLLLDTNLTAEQRSFASTIRSSADSLLTVINDILDFSKIEAGMLNFEILPFDLREPVESSLALIADRAHTKGLEIAYLIEENVPVYLRGDASRIHQILLNLVSNAVKFTTKGEVVINVTKEAELPDRHVRLKFRIKDTGIGLTPEDQAKLFQPFVQVDSSTTRRFGGTGLGLAICRQLATMMQGEIGVESMEGQGSTFWFTLVLPQQEATPKVIPRKSSIEGLRALIVDDNATNRNILERQLSSWRCDTITAVDGKDALGKIQQSIEEKRYFNFAIIDMNMPEMDGIEVTERIRSIEECTELKILLYSSMGQLLDQEKMDETGINASLLKPVRPSQLHDTLISLYAGAAPRPTKAPFASSSESSPEETASAEVKPLSILVAEDNLVNQHVARSQLAKFGYQADIESDGKAAVSAFKEKHYDLIFMDCQMPILDGYEATREIRKWEHENPGVRTHPVHIIAMTANAMAGDREACLDAGMDDYVSKPVRPSELAAAIARTPISQN